MATDKATKDLFKASLLRLTKTNCLSKISVKDILNETGAAKQTFYNHFSNKYDLINYVMMDAVEHLNRTHPMHTYQGILECLEYCEENKRFFIETIRHDECNDFRNFFYLWCVDYYLTRLYEMVGTRELPVSLVSAVKFYCHGATELFIDWISANMLMSKALLADTIVRCRPEALTNYFPLENSL